jgi:endonuclease/exonuclease/phosphatase family metal-dependent hydrolase
VSRALLVATPHRRTGFAGAVLLVLVALVSALALSGSADASTARRHRADEPLFRVASFNLLGFRHTQPGGDNSGGFADGRTRMGYAVNFLNHWRVDVVGFQEFEPEQRDKFMSLTGTDWQHYPGDTMTRIDMANSIAWRTADWQVVQENTIQIPYFHGELVDMPYVLLKSVATGREVWFANFHNPASVYGPAQKWRTKAMHREVNLANTLNDSGTPLVLTGDMNENTEYFCGMTTGAAMKAAAGGSFGTSTCDQYPPRPMGIDWIFGSNDGLTFSNYQRREGKLVQRTTDHPVVFADVTLPPAS